MNSGHHSAVEQMAGFVDAGRIDKDDLAVLAADDALNFVPRGLRFVRDGSDLFADEAIEQRRFSCIWAADERDVAAPKVLL